MDGPVSHFSERPLLGEPRIMERDGIDMERKQHNTTQESVVMQCFSLQNKVQCSVLEKELLITFIPSIIMVCFSSNKNETGLGASLSLTSKKSMDIASLSFGGICLGHLRSPIAR